MQSVHSKDKITHKTSKFIINRYASLEEKICGSRTDGKYGIRQIVHTSHVYQMKIQKNSDSRHDSTQFHTMIITLLVFIV